MMKKIGMSILKRYFWGKKDLLPARTKSILYFEPSSGYGGSGNSLFLLLAHLDRNKFRPIVVTFNNGPQFEKVKRLGIEVIKLQPKEIEPNCGKGIALYCKFGWDLLLNVFPVMFKLRGTIKRHNVELVHINTNILSGIPAILAAKIAGIHCISHIRMTRELIIREKVLFRWIDKVIILNRQALKMYQSCLDEDKLVLIYDGIDTLEFVENNESSIRKEFKLGEDVPIVGLVGRVVEGKGHKEFILAARQVLNTVPEAKFVIVGDNQGGDNSSKYFAEVKDLVSSEKLDKDILFTGWRDDIMNVIGGLDILVQASTTFPEGFGLTIVEAMALNKPVVATNIPGPSEIVVDGETGFLVPPGDAAALAEAILKLLNNPGLVWKMGEAGRKRVEQYFDIRKTAREVEKIYEEQLPENK